MNVADAVRTRLEIKDFSDKQVAFEDKVAILDAGRMAASGLNSQHWRFILVDDREGLETLARTSTTGEWVGKASFAVIVLTDRSYPWHLIDAGRALTHMQLAAWEKGIGSRIYTGIKEDEMRRIFGIPDRYAISAVIGFGYPARRIIGKKSRKELSEIAFYKRFGNPIKAP